MGIAALLVETYDSRRDLGTGFIEQVLNITETMFAADAYAALAYLATRPEVDPHRVALAGFSYGGMATQYGRCARAEWSALRRPCVILCTVHRPLCR
jgi:dienelactone hydrolase